MTLGKADERLASNFGIGVMKKLNESVSKFFGIGI